MKKLSALLVAAMFSLGAAMPASAAPSSDSMEMIPAPDSVQAKAPATKAVKSVKKHKQVRKAKHKPSKVRAHKRQRKH